MLAAPAAVFATPLPVPLNSGSSVHWFTAWDENNAPSTNTDFYPSPSVNNANISSVGGALSRSAAFGQPLAVKVETQLSNGVASALFNQQFPPNNQAISYVFGDFESPASASPISATTTLVKQVRNSSWSNNAYVGQLDLTPVTNDPSQRSPQPYTQAQYDSSGVNMANTMLYPGQGSFRSPAAPTGVSDWINPNIRTSLFIAPVSRMSTVQNVLNTSYNGTSPLLGPSYHKQIPWVTRFNNWGNSALDTDNNPANGYRFVPGAPLPKAGLSGSQTADQMMGRGDFSAQILHYRMRGAYSVNLFHEGGASGGVEGYSSTDAKQDVRDGWYGSSDPNVAHTNNVIYSQPDAKPATLTINPLVDFSRGPTGQRSEATGVLWSGAYSLTANNANSTNAANPGHGALDILASNMDTSSHRLQFDNVGGLEVWTKAYFGVDSANNNQIFRYTYYDAPAQEPQLTNKTITLDPGTHTMFQFDLVTGRVYTSTTAYTTKTFWLLNQQYSVFGSNDRNAVGIPEPTTFGALAAVGTLAAVSRRQRRRTADA